MKAAVITRHGGPEVIEITELDRPDVPPDHVLISVRAVALNHLDLWVRRGIPALDTRFPHIGGSDIAGTIEGLGERVTGLERGERVLVNPALWCGECEWCRRGEESLCENFRLLGEHVNGGLAQYAAVPARNVLPIPGELSFREAAAVPLVFQTAWRGLITRGGVRPGASVLVLGASGGVGTAAIQIAALAGARVFAVTSGPENVRRVEELGAELVIDRLSSEFSREIWHSTGKRGVDVIFEGVGQAVWEDAVRTLARDGRLVTYGATTGPEARLDIRRLFWKQLRIIGTTMASRSEFETVMSLVFARKLSPVIDVVWPLERIRDAHERLEAGEVFGKLVLEVS